MYLLARALGMSFAGGADGGDRLRAQPVAGRAPVLPARRGLGAAALAAVGDRAARPPPRRPARRPCSRCWWRCSTSAAIPRRASTCCSRTVAFFALRVVHGARQRRARAAARHGGGAGGGHRPRRDRAGAVRRAAAPLGGPLRALRDAASTSTSIPTYLLGFFLYDYWGRGNRDRSDPVPVRALLVRRRPAADARRGRADRCARAPSGSGSPGSRALLLAVIFGAAAVRPDRDPAAAAQPRATTSG